MTEILFILPLSISVICMISLGAFAIGCRREEKRYLHKAHQKGKG